jgi:hypothetical protein
MYLKKRKNIREGQLRHSPGGNYPHTTYLYEVPINTSVGIIETEVGVEGEGADSG